MSEAPKDFRYYLDHPDEMPTDIREIERLANEHANRVAPNRSESTSSEAKPAGETGNAEAAAKANADAKPEVDAQAQAAVRPEEAKTDVAPGARSEAKGGEVKSETDNAPTSAPKARYIFMDENGRFYDGASLHGELPQYINMSLRQSYSMARAVLLSGAFSDGEILAFMAAMDAGDDVPQEHAPHVKALCDVRELVKQADEAAGEAVIRAEPEIAAKARRQQARKAAGHDRSNAYSDLIYSIVMAHFNETASLKIPALRVEQQLKVMANDPSSIIKLYDLEDDRLEWSAHGETARHGEKLSCLKYRVSRVKKKIKRSIADISKSQ